MMMVPLKTWRREEELDEEVLSRPVKGMETLPVKLSEAMKCRSPRKPA